MCCSRRATNASPVQRPMSVLHRRSSSKARIAMLWSRRMQRLSIQCAMPPSKPSGSTLVRPATISTRASGFVRVANSTGQPRQSRRLSAPRSETRSSQNWSVTGGIAARCAEGARVARFKSRSAGSAWSGKSQASAREVVVRNTSAPSETASDRVGDPRRRRSTRPPALTRWCGLARPRDQA